MGIRDPEVVTLLEAFLGHSRPRRLKSSVVESENIYDLDEGVNAETNQTHTRTLHCMADLNSSDGCNLATEEI